MMLRRPNARAVLHPPPARGSRSPARGTVSSPTGLEHDGRWHPAIRDSEGGNADNEISPQHLLERGRPEDRPGVGGKRHRHLESERAPQSLRRGNLVGPASHDAVAPSSAWDGSHLKIGGYALWVHSKGRLRSSSAPPSDTDGSVVGTQT
jgi:hypothetical protein